MKLPLKESLIYIAIASFFAFQGFFAGKKLASFNFSLPHESGLKLGIAALIFGFFATLVQRSKLEALKGTAFIGTCFVISAISTLLSANIHQILDKAIGISILVMLFGVGISLGAAVKSILKFRIDMDSAA